MLIGGLSVGRNCSARFSLLFCCFLQSVSSRLLLLLLLLWSCEQLIEVTSDRSRPIDGDGL